MDNEVRAKLNIGAAATAPIPEAPANGEAKAQEAIRPTRRG